MIKVNHDKLIQKLKNSKLIEINQACTKTITSGFYSSALGSKHFYYSTIAEQSTLNSLINLGVANDFKAQKIELLEDVEIKQTRQRYTHTLDQLKQVLLDGALHINTVIQKKDELEAQVNAATTVEEVEAISW